MDNLWVGAILLAMRKINILILFFIFTIQPAWAGCYTIEQYKAEQVIRYHTRLMVLGMLCQGVLKQNTYSDYQAFTQRNQIIINEQENKLISYFKQDNQPNPDRALHSFRTDLANAISQQAAYSVTSFCQRYTHEWRQAKTMDPKLFKSWIASLNWKKESDTSKPLCGAVQK